MPGASFRKEYTAQAYAIRGISAKGGRLSWAERNSYRRVVDNNVDWEVGPKGSHNWRVDIVARDPRHRGGDTILEVKHFKFQNRVRRQLEDYSFWARALRPRVDFDENSEMMKWADKYDANGKEWWVWGGSEEGHIYFANRPPNEEVRRRVRGQSEGSGVGDIIKFIPLMVAPVPVG